MDKTFKDKWQNPRYKALIKLGGYLLFIGLVLIYILLTPKIDNKKSELKESTEISITDKKNVLLKGNYEYYYLINVNNQKIIYSGQMKNKVNIGIKETSLETIKYIEKNGMTYKVVLEEKTLINDLYEDINANYLKVDYIINLTNALTPNITTNEKNEAIYEYVYEDNNGQVVNIQIKYNASSLYHINIKENTNDYSLAFTTI